MASRTEYSANNLNQYTAESSFCPEFDADGNQTLIRTSTGIRNVSYNARNRPVRFEKADGSIVEECTYKAPEDLEGDWTNTQCLPRRGECPMRWVRINRYGEAETDSLLAGSMTHTITEQRDTLGRSTGYTYAKNDIPQQQTDIGYGADGRITSAGFTHQGEHKQFTYAYLPGTHLLHTLTHPNGLTLTQSYDATRDLPTQMDYSRADALVVQRAYTYDQSLRWSSEYRDIELGLHYYNYRHYNPAMGRGMEREPI